MHSRVHSTERTRWLPYEKAKKSVDAILPGKDYQHTLSRHLIVEGVLAEDLLYLQRGKKPKRILRFSYERFADHRIAKLMLETHLDKKNPERSFKNGRPLAAFFKDHYTYWLNQGLIGATTARNFSMWTARTRFTPCP